MRCTRCGAALPSEGFICLECGTMMNKTQIEKQKSYYEENKEKRMQAVLMSSKYGQDNYIERDNEKEFKFNNIIGPLLIIVVIILIIVLAIYINYFR